MHTRIIFDRGAALDRDRRRRARYLQRGVNGLAYGRAYVCILACRVESRRADGQVIGIEGQVYELVVPAAVGRGGA